MDENELAKVILRAEEQWTHQDNEHRVLFVARAILAAGYAKRSHVVEECAKGKDAAYAERDQLVRALSKMFPAWLERHPDSDTQWEDGWRWIVFIHLPTGQATWHIPDRELHWFDHLERRDGCSWDGHSTQEKYERLAAIGGAWFAIAAKTFGGSCADCALPIRNLKDKP